MPTGGEHAEGGASGPLQMMSQGDTNVLAPAAPRKRVPGGERIRADHRRRDSVVPTEIAAADTLGGRDATSVRAAQHAAAYRQAALEWPSQGTPIHLHTFTLLSRAPRRCVQGAGPFAALSAVIA
jgi:hypothetical protein